LIYLQVSSVLSKLQPFHHHPRRNPMRFLVVVLAVLFAATLSGNAQVPQKMSYQGLLTNSGGSPLPDGNYDLEFDLYNAVPGGALRFTQTQMAVPVERGTFSVVLSALPAVFSESLYVEVTVLSGPGIGSPLTFAPRTELTSAPYSLAPWVTSGNSVYYSSGNVGVGTTVPEATLDVLGGAHPDPFFSEGDFRIGNNSHRLKVGVDTLSGDVRMRAQGGTNRLMIGGGTSDALFIQNEKVGIGKFTPTYPLDVLGSINATDFLKNGVPFGPSQWTTTGSNIYFNSGNVGIGTATPGAKLDVNGPIRSSSSTYPNFQYNSANRIAFGETFVPPSEMGSVVQFGSGSASRNMIFAFTKTGYNTSFLGNNGFLMVLGSEGSVPITFRTSLIYGSADVLGSGIERMRIDGSGNVGIGTTAPSKRLEVIGSAKVSDTLFANIVSSNSSLRLQTGGATRISIDDATGNVGVGTTTPDVNARLDVNGYAFAKAPIVVYDSAAGSGNAFDVTWHNDVRIDNTIVEKQPNNYDFILKRTGWYRIAFAMYLESADNSLGYSVALYRNGSTYKVLKLIDSNVAGFNSPSANIVVFSNGSDVIKVRAVAFSVDLFHVSTGGNEWNQLSIEYLGAE
jgi:hypothetical protein